MKHNLKIKVSKKPQVDGIVTCKKLSIREKFLRFLLGDNQKITVLIPGDSVKEVSICESKEGGDKNEQN